MRRSPFASVLRASRIPKTCQLDTSESYLVQLSRQLFAPVIASVMRKRVEALFVSAFVLTQGALVLFGLPGWPCPVRHLLGIPCPGCGLTRATSEFMHGHWHESFALHAFAPLALLFVAVIMISSVLPSRTRAVFVTGIEKVERHTGVTTIMLGSAMLYWLIRLMFFPESVALLISR